MEDYYEILEVHPKASNEIIKKAYIVLAKKYHPDTTSLPRIEAERKMALLNKAYSILSNPEKRMKYDQTRMKNDTCTENASKKQYARPQTSQDENIIRYANKLSDICVQTLKLIQHNIKFELGHEASNQQLLDKFYDTFLQESVPIIQYLKQSSFSKNTMYIKPAFFVYYQFGVAYTWTKNEYQAIPILEEALTYIDDSDSNKSKVENLLFRLKKQYTSTHSLGKMSNKQVGVLVIIFIILCFIIGSCISIPTPTNPPKTNKTTPVEQHDTTKDPLPKKGVVSQYVPDTPQENTSGYSTLTIDNSKNSIPVYVRLWTSGNGAHPVRAFTVAQSSSFTLENLTPGTYEIRYKYMYENDDATTGAKSEPFTLKETKTNQGIQYDKLKLTLYTVKNGNTKMKSISVNDI